MPTINVPVAATSDNASDTSGVFLVSGTETELVHFGGADRHVGTRHQGVDIPQGALISSAFLRFTYTRTFTGGFTQYRVLVGLEDADDTTEFSTLSDFLNRPKTSSADWVELTAASAGDIVDTPDLTTQVQSIVNRAGWLSGNSMAVLMTVYGGSSNTEAWVAFFEHTTYDPPTLIITYNEPPVITVAPVVDYGSLTRLGPNNTPADVAFTATDSDETAANALSYEVRTAPAGGGTLVVGGTCTSGVQLITQIDNGSAGIVNGEQTLYLRVSDGSLWSDDAPFTLLVDRTAPAVGAIVSNPDPVQ